jgi:hypothetical protein
LCSFGYEWGDYPEATLRAFDLWCQPGAEARDEIIAALKREKPICDDAAQKIVEAIFEKVRARFPRSYRVPATTTIVPSQSYNLPSSQGPVEQAYHVPVSQEPDADFLPESRSLIESLDGHLANVIEQVKALEGLGFDVVLAEIATEPGGREDLTAVVEKAIAALGKLHQTLIKPPLEGKTIN